MAWQDHDWCGALSGSYADRVRAGVDRLDSARESGEIAAEDHERIHDLLSLEAADLANTTLQNRVQVLYKMAEREDTPLTEQNADSIRHTLARYKSGAHPDVKDDGIGVSNYQKALRKFYRHHDDLRVDDPMQIEIDKDEGKDLRPKDLLYRDEVDAILEQNRDLRDRALFALILATGQRNDAVRTLRIKHVESDGRTMEVRLNDTEGATKGASGTVPLLWAKHYVREWYEHHPFGDDPEAALFPPAKGAVSEDERRDPINQDSTTKTIKRMADRAGVEKPGYGVTPHILRASAITRMAAKGVAEQRIKQIAGWSRDSSQFATYVALGDDVNNDRAREELGYATSEQEQPVIGRPTLETCPNTGCGDPIPEGRDVCPTCGFDLAAPADEDPEPDTDGYADPVTIETDAQTANATMAMGQIADAFDQYDGDPSELVDAMKAMAEDMEE